jgi:Amt family ammonium transporter
MEGWYAWMIVATALVLMMTVPALALFYGGMTRSKSVLNMMMMSFVGFAIVGIVFVLWGWSEAFGSVSWLGGLFASPFELFGLHGVDPASWVPGVMFQMTFAAITAALISGAIADRVKLSAWAVFVPLWVTFAYFPVAHNVWGGGWLSTLSPMASAQDYAGGTVVHINAGMAGLVLALLIGKRAGFMKEPMKPHNLTLTMIGAGLLWFGWYGFNVGSYIASDPFDPAGWMHETGITFTNTTIATMAAMLGWLVMERILHGKATSLGAASGIVAGLVAITPACGSVDVLGAIAVGAVAGIGCAWAVGLKFKFGMDDSLDVVGVHLVGGLIGTLMIGLFSTTASAGTVDGLFYGGGLGSLWAQFLAALFTIVWTGVVTLIIGLAIKATIGWRIEREDEVEGIDLNEHGESAYEIGGAGGLLSGSSVSSTEGAMA